MDFFSHSNDIFLTNLRVKSLLHLFLERNLSIPKENLSLSLDNLLKDGSLLSLQLIDLILKSDRLIFQFLELLLELHLNVEVCIQKFDLSLLVLEFCLIELIHLKDLVFLVNLKTSDTLKVGLYLSIDSKFLLI